MTRQEAKRQIESLVSAGSIARGAQHRALEAALAGEDPVRACAPSMPARASVGTLDAEFDRYVAASFPQTRGRRVTAQTAPRSDAQALTDACRATPATVVGY